MAVRLARLAFAAPATLFTVSKMVLLSSKTPPLRTGLNDSTPVGKGWGLIVTLTVLLAVPPATTEKLALILEVVWLGASKVMVRLILCPALIGATEASWLAWIKLLLVPRFTFQVKGIVPLFLMVKVWVVAPATKVIFSGETASTGTGIATVVETASVVLIGGGVVMTTGGVVVTGGWVVTGLAVVTTAAGRVVCGALGAGVVVTAPGRVVVIGGIVVVTGTLEPLGLGISTVTRRRSVELPAPSTAKYSRV